MPSKIIRRNKTVRLTPGEEKQFEELMRENGFTQFSPFVRFAIMQLKKRTA